MLPVVAGEILIVAGLLLTLPATAVIETEPVLLIATKVVVAMPLTVDPVVFDRLPNVLSLKMKLTRVPSGTDVLFPLTKALSVDVPKTVMPGGLGANTTLSGGGEEIDMVVKALTGVTGGPVSVAVAVTFTEVTIPLAVSVIEALPFTSVIAELAERVTAPGLSTLKFTVWPALGPTKPLSMTFMAEVSKVRIDEGTEDMVNVGTRDAGLIVTVTVP